MKKLVFLFVMLLLVSVVGCSSDNSVTGPESSDQIQTDAAQKPVNPGDPTDGGDRPETSGDPHDGLTGP